jgi:hypothetical protein
MTYVLEKIKPADAEKILLDSECDLHKHQALLASPLLAHNPDATWAIDRAKNTYLYLISGSNPDSGFIYYLYHKNTLYEIELEGGFSSHRVKFMDSTHPVPPLLYDLQQEIRNAFAIYGRFGTGVGNDDWMLKVEAKFEGKK